MGQVRDRFMDGFLRSNGWAFVPVCLPGGHGLGSDPSDVAKDLGSGQTDSHQSGTGRDGN
jgi:hypothetical protein